MLTALGLAILGAVLGRYYRIGSLIAASFLILSAHVMWSLYKLKIDVTSFLMLVSNLASTQVGFLVGSYLSNNSVGR